MKYVMRIKDRIPVRKVTAMTEAMRDNGVWCSGRMQGESCSEAALIPGEDRLSILIG